MSQINSALVFFAASALVVAYLLYIILGPRRPDSSERSDRDSEL